MNTSNDDIERLRKENEQLLERIAELYRSERNKVMSARSVECDIGTLQGEIKALRETIGEIDRQHEAEIAQLRSAHTVSIDALEAEIERLRDMLDKIAKHPDTPELLKQYAMGRLHGHR